jgi:hypothetical protein
MPSGFGERLHQAKRRCRDLLVTGMFLWCSKTGFSSSAAQQEDDFG